MRVLITGSRDWVDASAVERVLAEFDGPDTVLVSGNCPSGADLFAERFAESRGWVVERHPADWAAFGSYAGPKRNKEMVASGVDVVVGFVKDGSRGASGTVREALKFDIWVKVMYFDSVSSSVRSVEHNEPVAGVEGSTLF